MIFTKSAALAQEATTTENMEQERVATIIESMEPNAAPTIIKITELDLEAYTIGDTVLTSIPDITGSTELVGGAATIGNMAQAREVNITGIMEQNAQKIGKVGRGECTKQNSFQNFQ